MNRKYRIKKSEEIEKTIKEKKYSFDAYFSVYQRKNPETSHFRYAVSVGKKIGNAVLRNKIKRQIRAILLLLPISLDKNIDVFIIAKEKVKELNFQQMKEHIEYLFIKQKLIKGEKND